MWCSKPARTGSLRYRRETPARYAEPVLFCYALINRPYILDLLPDKSVVRRYLEEGFDVYIIDWGVPSDGDRHLTLENYVCGFLKRSIRHVLPRARRATTFTSSATAWAARCRRSSRRWIPSPIRS